MKANDVFRRKESGRFSLSDFPSLQHPIAYGKASLPRWFISSLCQRIWLGHRQVQRDLMTVLAPPCSVATPVREETGLRAPSAQGAAFHTWEAAGPRLDAQGACFQHPRVEWRWAGGMNSRGTGRFAKWHVAHFPLGHIFILICYIMHLTDAIYCISILTLKHCS